MTASNPTASFIKPLQDVLGAPKCPNPAFALKVLADELVQFDDETLRAASRWYLVNRKYSTWPTPAEALKIAKEEEAKIKHRKGVGLKRAEATISAEADPHSPQTDLLVKDLLATDMGRLAADEGWIGGLEQFIREHRRLPDAHESQTVKEGHLHFRRLIRRSAHGPARSTAEAIEGRAQMLAKIAYGERR
jgi:hypothetical protein